MESEFKIAISYADEKKDLAYKVYYYLKAEGIRTFFAPSPEGQAILSGKNQREIFYKIFGLSAEYVALLVSEQYIRKTVPMEEANIALTKHRDDGKVIPIYTDEARLPKEMVDPEKMNYFKSSNPVEIATHLASKIKSESENKDLGENRKGSMNIQGNIAERQIIIQGVNGKLTL